jgi:hypothetical protein
MRMGTKAKVWLGLLVGGGAVIAAMVAYMLRQPYDHRITAHFREDAASPIASGSETNTRDSSTRTRSETHLQNSPDGRFRFIPGQDALAFIENLLDEARAGNRDAQYAIYEAMIYCDDTYALHFDRREGRLALEDALALARQRKDPRIEEIRTSYATCNTLKAENPGKYGSANEWLEKASDLGLPRAQARNASIMLMHSKLGILPANATREDRTEALEARSTLAIDLMVQALNSKDPAATWEIAHALNALTGHFENDNGDMWVWRLAACKQGFDCSAGARWKVSECFFDPFCYAGETGIDYIRRQAADLRPNVDSEADTLLARLNHGSIDRVEFERLVGKKGQ